MKSDIPENVDRIKREAKRIHEPKATPMFAICLFGAGLGLVAGNMWVFLLANIAASVIVWRLWESDRRWRNLERDDNAVSQGQ